MAANQRTLKGDIKVALRISHNSLDDEIDDYIAAAKAEMERAGVSFVAANTEDDPLIKTAIKTFVKSKMAEKLESQEKYKEAFDYQLNEIRKSGKYIAEVADV